MYNKPKLRRNFDVIELSDNAVLFKSEHSSIKFEGKDVTEFIHVVLPKLDGKNTFDEIMVSLTSSYKEEDIRNCFKLLINNNLLEEGKLDDGISASQWPRIEFINDMGISAGSALKKMSQSTVTVFGLTGHGAYLVSALANEGIGKIRCIDITNVSAEDLYVSPIYQEADIGNTRERALVERLRERFPSTRFETSDAPFIDENNIDNLIGNSDLIVSCMDKGFSSIYYWLNKASLRRSIPLCIATIDGVEGIIGPMFIPGVTACYMCYMMRLTANKSSYADTMAYYKYLDNRKKDEFHKRSTLGVHCSIVGNYLALEIVKEIIDITHQLVGRICIINFLSLSTEFHTVLRNPSCPHCSQKKKTIEKSEQPPVNILQIEPKLVSQRTGIITSINRLPKDSSEPELPYIFGVSLSNFNYSNDSSSAFQMCSGKGITLEDARTSALGEAIERYCASQYDESKIIISSYEELRNAISPVQLVLYSDEQYKSGQIPYARFSEKSKLGWVEGYSLSNNRKVLLPAIGVYLYYHPIDHHDYLFSTTSSGLAAGNTIEDAILNALLEVIERDAFLITWLCRLPMPQIDLHSINNKYIQQLTKMYERRGVSLHVNALILDTNVVTFMATAVDTTERGPAAVVGLSAHTDPEIGIFKAILEIGQLRSHLKREIRTTTYLDRITNLMNFQNVKTIEDHELLYTSQQMLHCFDFLLYNRKNVGISQLPKFFGSSSERLRYCVNNISKTGVEIISLDLSTPDIQSLGLSVARVIVTEFQPIHFGFNEARLGGSRLFKIPRILGFYNHDLTMTNISPYPHPLG